MILLSLDNFLQRLINFLEGLESFMEFLAVVAQICFIGFCLLVLGAIFWLGAMIFGFVVYRKTRHQTPVKPFSAPHKTDPGQVAKGSVVSKDSQGNVVSIAWEEIETVHAIVLDRKKTKHWAFLALQNEALGKNILIAHSDPRAIALLESLCLLPGFDRSKLSNVLASPEPGRQVIWQRM